MASKAEREVFADWLEENGGPGFARLAALLRDPALDMVFPWRHLSQETDYHLHRAYLAFSQGHSPEARLICRLVRAFARGRSANAPRWLAARTGAILGYPVVLGAPMDPDYEFTRWPLTAHPPDVTAIPTDWVMPGGIVGSRQASELADFFETRRKRRQDIDTYRAETRGLIEDLLSEGLEVEAIVNHILGIEGKQGGRNAVNSGRCWTLRHPPGAVAPRILLQTAIMDSTFIGAQDRAEEVYRTVATLKNCVAGHLRQTGQAPLWEV